MRLGKEIPSLFEIQQVGAGDRDQPNVRLCGGKNSCLRDGLRSAGFHIVSLPVTPYAPDNF